MSSPLSGSRARAVICAIVAAAAFILLVAEVRATRDPLRNAAAMVSDALAALNERASP